MGDDTRNESSVVPNEFTLGEQWKDIGTTMATNGLVGASVGFLVSLVLLRKRRAVMVGFSSGIGVGVGWRDSHAASQFTRFSNLNFEGTTLPTLKDKLYGFTADLTGSGSGADDASSST